MHFKFSIAFLLLFACGKKSSFPVDIIGHAGNGLSIQSSIYHSNSLESIELALGTAGVKGVEIDLQLSADNELWLLHDRNLETETTGNGCVSESTYAELSTIRFKTVNKEKLVRLKDLNFSAYSGKIFYLDIRHYNGCTEALIDQNTVITALQPIITEWNDVQFIVITNHKPWLDGFSDLGWTVYSDVESLDEIQTLKQYNYHYDGIVIRNSVVTKEDIAAIKSENKKVILFDVRAPKPIRQALKKQPDGIIADDLKAALIEKSN